jgi:hypothetical protein
MQYGTHRIIAVLALILAMALVPAAARAQEHAHGSTWVHRNADHGTMLHAEGDSLCVLEFPDRCFGGMMAPDSVHCEFRIVPPESLPDWCPVADDLEMHDPDGGSMMSGHMMPHGFFQRSLQLTIHYEPYAVAALGIDPADLVLITSTDGYEIVAEAAHDADSNVFRLSTSRPAGWYGVADRTNLPVAVEDVPWGRVKATYR